MANPDEKTKITIDSLRKGDFRTVARAVSLVENEGAGATDLLKSLEMKLVPVIGITGPPGAGKSTLVDALTRQFTDAGKKIAILCVDPSSSFHRGALLGDRIRMNRWSNNPLVYIRSLASRGSVGGLHPKIFQITDLLSNAGFDYIIIETVGVGQTEIEISRLAHQVLLVLVPESGDDIQTIKSGIMEIADIFVVNKSDRPGADTFMNSLKSSIHYQTTKPLNEIHFVQTVAPEDKGIADLYTIIQNNLNKISSRQSVNLFAQKAWQLIASNKMRNISVERLEKLLEKELSQPHFNVYVFADTISSGI